MRANYHTHTPRCRHASGTPAEYVETALNNGLQILGFSDHVPYPFSNGYRSGFRMDVSETEAYTTEIMSLQDAFKERLQILIGYEAEYYPAEFAAMLENILQYPCDYLILGQHCLGNEYDGPPSGGPMRRERELQTYVDQCIAGLQTGLFSCLAHPDLPRFTGLRKSYRWQMERLCKTAKELEIPLELNLLGLHGGRNYPDPAFWSIAAEVGNQVIVGCDAHQPGGGEIRPEPGKRHPAGNPGGRGTRNGVPGASEGIHDERKGAAPRDGKSGA